MKKGAFRALASVLPFLAMGELGHAASHIEPQKENTHNQQPIFYPSNGISPKDYGLYIATKSSVKLKSKLKKVRSRK